MTAFGWHIFWAISLCDVLALAVSPGFRTEVDLVPGVKDKNVEIAQPLFSGMALGK